jgi:hypothetical protein
MIGVNFIIYDTPLIKFERLQEIYPANVPKRFRCLLIDINEPMESSEVNSDSTWLITAIRNS